MPRTILVVDDNAMNRMLLREIVCADYTVLEAVNGQEAMERLARSHGIISAVLLDIVMPVMNGFEVLERMREDAQFSQIPVIVTTGNTDLAAENRALALGANDFVGKPFDAGVIRRRLDNLIKLRETAAMVNTLQKDALTGLWNREAFFDRAARYVAQRPAGYYILSSVDIDSFKVINDQYGTEKGDEVLVWLAGELQRDFGGDESLCGRVSADHFVLLFPARMLPADAERPDGTARFTGIATPVTISTGQYRVDDLTLSVRAMYDRANIAQATVKGRYDRHTARYNESMRGSILREQAIVNEMEAALAQGQFEAWFQPQYNHATGALIGAEALARWRHPIRGMISPGEFIPVFERNGFIYELDKYIWAQVCGYLRKWLDEGRTPLPVSVNISRYDLFHPDLVDRIESLMRRFDLPEDLLRLEITESAFVSSAKDVVEAVKRLIARGFTVEIDDFGSGYSSLNTLKDVPGQVVKLDMHFLEGGENAERGGNILESIVRMTKWLGMAVIAEGVEEASQADYLKSIGCNYVQGYFYAKPMPAAEYEALFGKMACLERLIDVGHVDRVSGSAFWSPQSMDTLILNSFVGAACIFEYCEGHIELIRATDQYARVLGNPVMTVAEALKLDWSAYLDADNLHLVTEAVKRSIDTKGEAVGEYMFLGLPGCPEKTYLRSSLRVISTARDRYLIFCKNENITAQREAERKEREAVGRQRASAQQLQAVVSNIASGVTAIVLHADDTVEPLLVTDRYFELLGYTREQFRAEVRDPFAPISGEDVGWVLPKVRRLNHVGQCETLEYRVNRRDGREIWLRDAISVIRLEDVAAPVQLSVFTDITLSRKQSDQLKALTETIPGGLAALRADAGGIRILYFNDGFFRYSGYGREAFQALIRDNPLALVFDEDVPGIYKALERFRTGDESAVCTYRCRTKSGGFCWFELKGAIAERREDALLINIVQFDVTDRKLAEEQLRLSEEQFRAAASISGLLIARYDIKAGVYTHHDRMLLAMGFGERVENVPQAFIDAGLIARDSVGAYRAFFEKIRRGVPGSVDFAAQSGYGKYRWWRREAKLVSDAEGRPTGAIFVTSDITEQREKEAAYAKWQQSLREKPAGAYTLFRSNISRDEALDRVGGTLLKDRSSAGEARFGAQVAGYAGRYVYDADRSAYLAFMNPDTLIADYYRGKRAKALEFRELTEEGENRWLRLTVDLVEYPNSADVEAYLMFEDIDERKKREMLVREMAEADPLTGVLNRTAFVGEFARLMREAAPGARHALMMLDVDGFKLLNDCFGHAAGDQALIDIANGIRAALRPGDLVGRLGGDEFLICLSDISDDAEAAMKAAQVCALMRRAYSAQVQISGSVGLALCPRDGSDFDALYRKADAALYAVKESGKDGYALFSAEMGGARPQAVRPDEPAPAAARPGGMPKRRMLVVDDNALDVELLTAIFKDEYTVEKVNDGSGALIRLRHFGSSISVVLLDLLMKGMDGFEVLEKMRGSAEMRSIPVIVVSGCDDRETALRVIERGATDFVTKPIDSAIMRLRVQSAVSKAENERLRAQNSCLSLQNSEIAKYRAVLENTGTAVIEYDWLGGAFTYDPSVSHTLAGRYDGRKFWHILLADQVADAMTVKDMQNLVHAVAGDRARMRGKMRSALKTPSGETRTFCVNVIKLVNEYHLTSKIIITLNESSESDS